MTGAIRLAIIAAFIAGLLAGLAIDDVIDTAIDRDVSSLLLRQQANDIRDCARAIRRSLQP
jgi:4-hydroxybenzoate polyprenyltransferase